MLRYVFIFFSIFSVAFANTLPFDFHFDNVKQVKEKYYDYGMAKDYKQNYYGPYWEEKYSFKDKQTSKQRFQTLSQKILNTLDNPSLSFRKGGFLDFEYEGEEYFLYLQTFASGATVKLVQSGVYKPFLSLGVKIWPLSKSMAKKGIDVPLLEVAPNSEELVVERLKYKKYDEKTFREKKYKVKAKGKHWSIHYKLKKYTKTNLLRYRAAQNYKRLLKKEHAVIEMKGESSFLFELDYEGKYYVGEFFADNNSMRVEIFEEKKFQQTLVLNPDKLKAELDKNGKVTLEGIYFDTDKATLKKESNSAILAAASLMKHYSDLVLEIQGHTDNQGDEAYNLKLSKRRAAAVADALVNEGVERNRLNSKGYGESRPVADNTTKEGREKNRRVELHRLSGGDEITMITIDFIKPLPNAYTSFERHYSNETLVVHYTPPYAKKKFTQTIEAPDHDLYKYDIVKLKNFSNDLTPKQRAKMIRDAKIDKSFSRVEIITNYRNILPMLGAETLGEDGNNLYFTFADRGDGRAIYGVIRAYEGTYDLHIYTMEQKKVVQEKEETKKPSATTRCDSSFVGTWRAKPELSQKYNTKASGFFLTKMDKIKLQLHKDGSMTLSDGKADEKGRWRQKAEKLEILPPKGEGKPGENTELTCIDPNTLLVKFLIIKEEPTQLVFKKE